MIIGWTYFWPVVVVICRVNNANYNERRKYSKLALVSIYFVFDQERIF